MATEIKAPSLPESVPDGTIATWYKKVGRQVSRDELLVDIETDKVLLEVVAPTDGVLRSIAKEAGAKIVSNEVLAVIDEGASAAQAPAKAQPAPAAAAAEEDNSK